ncbi:hypothetical protein HQQ94_15005 [Shewanella sp. VB17]|nr:hypothetical protein [Shewanella sp. VB17]
MSQVSLSPRLAHLDLASSTQAVSKRDIASFTPEQVPLQKANTSLVSDICSKAQQTRDEAIKASDEAKKIGVDIAKSGFFAKLGSLALSGTALGVSIAATVLTGGAGLPLLIASGVAFTLAVADAGCAFADWRGKAGRGDGLAMGSDAIANGVNVLLGKMGVADDKAQWWAKAASITSRVALTIGTIWSAVIAPVSLPHNIAGTVNIVNMARKSVGPIADGLAHVSQIGPNQKKSQLTRESQHKNLSAKGLEAKGEQLKGLQGEKVMSELKRRLQQSDAKIKTALFDAEIREKQSELHQNKAKVLRGELAQKESQITNMERQLKQFNRFVSESKLELTDVTQQLKALQQVLSPSSLGSNNLPIVSTEII